MCTILIGKFLVLVNTTPNVVRMPWKLPTQVLNKQVSLVNEYEGNFHRILKEYDF